MSDLLSSRRGFLSGLTKLPLIGGGIALIGAPSAVAEPVTDDLLEAYSTWLFYERRMVSIERARGDKDLARQYERFISVNNPGDGFFFGNEERWAKEPPSGRAAIVLSAVGCDWREV